MFKILWPNVSGSHNWKGSKIIKEIETGNILQNFQSDSSNACKQGCRLFTITELTAGAEAAKKSCDEGCADAYGKDSEKVAACKDGCKHQTAGDSKANGNVRKLFQIMIKWRLYF